MREKDEFKREARNMVADEMEDRQEKCRGLFSSRRRTVAGFSPVRAMIDGTIPLEYVSKKA